jgi:hypothetical protein
MRKGILVVFILAWCGIPVFSQDTVKTAPQVRILEGDTIPLVDVRAVVIFPNQNFGSKREAARYTKLVKNVKKVYPYAKLAGKQLAMYDQVLDTIKGEKARKQYMKQAEKELEAKFGDEIKELTFSQGKILIKLVYRETGNTTFEIVRELRGKFSAFIWQTMARIFGYDLKTEYDPQGNDQAIEQIVLMIEAGAL